MVFCNRLYEKIIDVYLSNDIHALFYMILMDDALKSRMNKKNYLFIEETLFEVPKNEMIELEVEVDLAM